MPVRPFLALAALLLVFASGCGDDNPSSPGGGADAGSELAGSWQLTRFEANGMDAITNGTSILMTFTPAPSSASAALRGITGTWSVEVLNDTLDLCDGETDCTPTGTFEVTATGTLVFDPGTESEITWQYTVVGATLTLTGTIDGIAVSASGTRASSGATAATG